MPRGRQPYVLFILSGCCFTNTCASVIRESEDSRPKVSVNELVEEHAVFSPSPSTQMLTVYKNTLLNTSQLAGWMKTGFAEGE